MDFEKLTKNAKYILGLMYKHYLDNLSEGNSIEDAKSLGDAGQIQETIAPEYSLADIVTICRELNREGAIEALIYDGTIYYATLTDSTVAYMESRFKKGLLDVVSFLSQFLP